MLSEFRFWYQEYFSKLKQVMCSSSAALGWKWFPPAAATYSTSACRWAAAHLPSLPRRWLLPACGLAHREACVSLSWLSEVETQPIGTGGGVGVSLPWSLHHSQKHAARPISLPAKREGASQPNRRCAHCGQWNPSETSFSCWEEAQFLSNRSTLCCCFLSGLGPASSEISGKMCSYP